jgi:hypothetical protein
MVNLVDLQRAAAAARTARDDARAALRGHALNLQELELALRRATRESSQEGRGTIERLRREQEALRSALQEGGASLAHERDRTIGLIDQLLVDPEALVAQLEDSTPFVLLPVRIETKFSSGQQGNLLRVRVFPDDIAVAHHEKELTVGEEAAGHTYWTSRAKANGATSTGERETRTQGAWNLLGSRYGAYRASWITLVTKPENWSDTVTDPEALTFPTLQTKPVSWSDVPRSPVMPDRFAIILERGTQSRTVFGRYVPDDLPLGPDPLHAQTFLRRDPASHRLDISDDLRWLVDFDRAEAVGMGVRIELTPEEASVGFDRILVLGVRVSTDRAGSTALLTRLIESHRYSQGVSLIPQGTPSNNTDEAASSSTKGAPDSVAETYALEHDTTPFPVSSEPMAQSDGQRLADALGVSYDTVRTLPNARGRDVAESVAMNRVLWSATLGHYVKEMLEGTFASADVSRVRLFLTEFVHGRGVLPALRVGTQPYGVLVTSSFPDWQWSPFEEGEEGDFWARLQAQLSVLRQHWMLAVASSVRFVGKRDVFGTLLDPFETLIDIIGLQASSVEFWSRTAVPESYLTALASYRGNDPDLVNNWIANARNQRILDLANTHLPHSDKAQIRKVLFLDTPDRVSSPIIDGDPTVPLSESRTIRPYDTTHNYIDWLASASNADLQSERFVGSDGRAVAAPDALLYKLLRVAVLSEVNMGSREIAVRINAAVFAEAPAMGDTPNIREPVLMPAHYTLIDSAKLGLTPQSATVGDYLLGSARSISPIAFKPPEAAPLAALTDALRVLAQLPTARLERLFAEHIDVVSHRLDAWLSGVFARRLRLQREQQREPGGIYLGAYGWVENVRPAKDRRFLEPGQIPPELSEAVDGPVTTYASNGGFVQAPSLTHAVTAAVLRNGYLTHAEPAHADQMSVNLSSARVRTGLRYIEGLQNGQGMSELLGYQLERGLHEGHPGVELDAFIYVLRERFPLISKKLTATPDGLSAEVIEARNVINGYDLLDFAKGKDYPFGIAGLPSLTGSATEQLQAKAINTEVDALRNALDAVADLLLSESVHQVVQGNYARGRGALQGLTDGELPPLPEVVQTPRSGKSLTHRMAVMLDPAASAGWNATLTPRAQANAPLNHWISTLLPSPNDVQWMVTFGTAAPQFVSLSSLGLEPLDVVLMCSERAGDLSGALERLLIYDFRVTHAVADSVATFFFQKTDPAIADEQAMIVDPRRAAAGKFSLGSLLPLIKALRRLVCGSRALGARDLMRATEAQNAHPENPNGYDAAAGPLKDLGELRVRIDAAHGALKAEQGTLQTLVTTMQPLAEALAKDATLAIQPAWTTLVPKVRTQLRAIFAYGVLESMPFVGQTLSRALVSEAYTQASGVNTLLQKKLAAARALLDISFPDPLPAAPDAAATERGRRAHARLEAYSSAAHELFGADCPVVQLFTAHPEGQGELAMAAATPVEGNAMVIESWLQALSRVRPALQALGTVATYHEWLSAKWLAPIPLQLPVAPGAKWIGGEFADTVKADDVVSILIENPPPNFVAPLAGLLVDEWTELVPATHETTGIAMHVNRPNAVAPQALLVAVAPRQGGHWAWSDLVAILQDTLSRAQLRAVEPDHVKNPYFQVLPPIVTAFNNSWMLSAAKFATSDNVLRMS